MNALTKTDRLFLTILAAACLFQLFFLFGPPILFDEPFYASLPFRLVQGDSLVRDEWHLTQFSTLFSYLPVRLWYALRGSADGLIVFLRCLYLAIHSAAAILIYKVFRKAGTAAIVASMIFYLQTPYRIYSISYLSMFALFLLLFSLSLLYIYNEGARKYCFFAGVSFGACCVSNPFFCAVALLFPLLFLLWKKRNSATRTARRRMRKETAGNPAKDSETEDVSKKEPQPLRLFFESCGCFFRKQTLLYGLLGVAAVAVTSVIFFFATGGRLNSLFQNLNYLFSTSEYQVASFAMREKFNQFLNAVNSISFHMPFLLPLLFLVLFFDRKRKNNSHRIVYLCAALLLSVLHLLGTVFSVSYDTLFFSLPFFLLSTVCFLLTEKKNYKLFTCMWCPCAVAAAVIFFASNTVLSSVGIVLAVSNVAGVFFAWDLLKELQPQQKTSRRKKKSQKPESGGKLLRVCRAVICCGLALQLLIYIVVLAFGQRPFQKNNVRITEGPYSGIRMPEGQYETYESFLRDLDVVKANSESKDPLLIVAFQNWLYLYAERPVAAHTVWFRGNIRTDDLLTYYRINPQRIPKYIYVVNSATSNMESLQDLFSFTEEKLSGGVLLTVTDCRFEV